MRIETVRRGATNLLLALLTCLFGIFVIEIGLRVHYPPLSASPYLPGTVSHFNALGFHTEHRYNNAGYRDEDFSETKPENEFRIVLIGDSFAEGYGVEVGDSFANQLENLLADSGKVTVYNLGVIGTAPDDYLQYLSRDGMRFSPDLVIVVLFVGNDLSDLGGYCSSGTPADFSSGEIPESLFFRAAPYTSHLLRRVRKRLDYVFDPLSPLNLRRLAWKNGIPYSLIEERRKKLDPRSLQDAADWKINPHIVKIALIDPDVLYNSLFLAGPRVQCGMGVFGSICAGIRKRTGTVPVLFFPIPLTVQVSPKYFGALERMGFHLDARMVTENAPQDFFKAKAEEYGFLYTDILDSLRKSPDPSPFFETDIHFNGEGNLRAARHLARFIREKGLIGNPSGHGPVQEKSPGG